MKKTYIAFHKPFGVLCQFTGEDGDRTLADFDLPKGIYAAGRLDKDSEGLLVLTNDGVFNQKLTNPKSQKNKTYWVQVEKIPSEESLDKLRKGVLIQKYQTLPCQVKIIQPQVPPRVPPIRERKNIPTCWLEMTIQEGKNRQVRRMTAAVGHPTLRLIRVKVGKLNLADLPAGEYREIKSSEVL
jgi:23S rRNA pseudouridine2457 synthase